MHPLLATISAGAVLCAGALSQSPNAQQIERGRKLFDKPFHIADGVGGPGMNADSCRACHQDPIMGGAGGLELNVTRFGRDNGGMGPFVNLAGGQGLSKLYPPHVEGREEHPLTADVFEQRQTPSILGDGLVDGIPDAIILAGEDPNDLNGDGIFGVARRLTVAGQTEIGRFGWKGQIPHLRDFVHDAMFGELGITTPDEGRGFQVSTDNDGVADPELTSTEIDDLTAFLLQLPAPQRKGSTDPAVALGEQIFTAVSCSACHTPTLASPAGPVRLYSNLLLHNITNEGFRGMAEPGAASGFYQTPPLWGIAETAPYMHDGSAEDLRQAILAHSGEASGSTQLFVALQPSEQQALLRFLEDL